jgi:hypothetical protein
MKNYSSKYNLFFVHIPKNAGTSINEFLEIKLDNRGHRTPSQLSKLYTKYSSTPSFAVIRNPWDRMVSLYKFRKNKGHDKHLIGDYSFQQWLLSTQTPKMAGHMEWANQYDLLFDETNLVSEIVEYSNLEEQLTIFLKKLGHYTISLPHLNSTNREHYSSYYNDECIDFVAKRFEKDIKAFGYEFED